RAWTNHHLRILDQFPAKFGIDCPLSKRARRCTRHAFPKGRRAPACHIGSAPRQEQGWLCLWSLPERGRDAGRAVKNEDQPFLAAKSQPLKSPLPPLPLRRNAPSSRGRVVNGP
ncbi:unnamed protein product, partial [Ectocarpus sp. 12 AP-2014]